MKSDLKASYELLDSILSELERELTKFSNDNKFEIHCMAEQHAKANLPPLHDTTYEAYIKKIRAQYKAIQTRISLALAADVQEKIGDVSGSETKKKLEWIDEQLKELREQRRCLEVEQKRIDLSPRAVNYKRYRLYLGILSFGDSLWMMLVFLKFGSNYLFAAALGVFFGFVQLIVVQKFVETLKETVDPLKARKRLRIFVTGSIVWSLIVGGIREFSSSVQGLSAFNPLATAFVFAFINLIIITAIALLVYRNSPTDEELKSIQRYENLQRKIQALDAQILRLEKEKLALLSELADLLKFQERLGDGESKLKELAASRFEYDCGVYVEGNLIMRPDRQMPDCFHNPIQPL